MIGLLKTVSNKQKNNRPICQKIKRLFFVFFYAESFPKQLGRNHGWRTTDCPLRETFAI